MSTVFDYRSDFDKIKKCYFDDEVRTIEEAIANGLTNEEIDLFAVRDKEGFPVYNTDESLPIYNAIRSCGSDSKIVSLLTQRTGSDGISFPSHVIPVLWNLFNEEHDIDMIEALIPKGKLFPLHYFDLKLFVSAAKEEKRTPEEIKACINKAVEYNEFKGVSSSDILAGKAPLTKGILFKEPTSLAIAGYRNSLFFDKDLSCLVKTASAYLRPDVLTFILKKDDEGNFVMSADDITDLFSAMNNFNPHDSIFSLIPLQKPDGSYIFSPEYCIELVKIHKYCLDRKKDDSDIILALASTDENGTPLLTAEEVEDIAYGLTAVRKPEGFWDKKSEYYAANYINMRISECIEDRNHPRNASEPGL